MKLSELILDWATALNKVAKENDDIGWVMFDHHWLAYRYFVESGKQRNKWFDNRFNIYDDHVKFYNHTDTITIDAADPKFFELLLYLMDHTEKSHEANRSD